MPPLPAGSSPQAVVCDLAPLSVLSIEGPDAAAFLNGQLSNDVSRLTAATFQFTSYNSPGGRMLANMLLWRDVGSRDAAAGGDRFCALVSGDIAEPVRKRLAMYVLRSKVKLSDVSSTLARLGVGGAAAGDALRAVFGSAPPVSGIEHHDSTVVLGLPGSRHIVLAPLDRKAALETALEAHARRADFEVWRWLTIHAGIPVITAATQDKFVPQTVNWDVLGGIDFQKGCYTGQEIIARTQYLGRLKERLYAFSAPCAGIAAGERLWSAAFGDQPCGTVVNSAEAPQGGCDLLAVLQVAAADTEVRAGGPDGVLLTRLPLPYAVPPPAAPRGRGG